VKALLAGWQQLFAYPLLLTLSLVAAAAYWRFWCGQVLSAAAICGKLLYAAFTPQLSSSVCAHHALDIQDDTYTESYISTIGVDFVSDLCF